jgi:multidrug efflux pump subunit AcrB
LDVALRWRYTTLAVFVASMIVTVGLLAGGHVRSFFFPRLPGDVAVATLEMPDGTNAEVTRRVLERIEAKALELREELDGTAKGSNQPEVVKHILVAMGAHPVGQAQDPMQLDSRSGGSHLAEVSIEFQNLHERGISSESIAALWRDKVGPVAGARRLTFDATEGNENKDIHIRLTSHKLNAIETNVEGLKNALGEFKGVYEIADTLGSRRREITLAMKPTAETLGLRGADLARQVRQAFYGEEAQRVQRGRDDIRVMVRYPLSQRRSIADLNNLRIRTPAGDEVPLGEVAEIQFGEGLATIRRSGRKRIADVTANLNRELVESADGIMAKLKEGVLGDLPEGMWSPEGGMKDQERVMNELRTGFFVALFAMYALMAIAFKSYIQPLLIAAAIPFGFVGAVGGHILLNQTVSIISFLGLVALAGVVVNDSLVLIDAINRLARQGKPIGEAVRIGARQRFRAILLTSLTTFVGLTPMMTETSVQARFIIPMAVALAFGVAFATVVTLTLVPALYLMVEDAARLLRWLTGAPALGGEQFPPSPEAEPFDAAA